MGRRLTERIVLAVVDLGPTQAVPTQLAWTVRKWSSRFCYISAFIFGAGIASIPLGLIGFTPFLHFSDLLFASKADPPYLGFVLCLGLVLFALLFRLFVLAVFFSRFSLKVMWAWYISLAGSIALVFYIEDAERAFPATFFVLLVVKLVADLVRNDPGFRKELSIPIVASVSVLRKNSSRGGAGDEEAVEEKVKE